MKISTYGLTDTGKVRARNEDSFLVDDAHRVYAVADGLGGLPEGARASNLAIHGLRDLLGTAGNGDGFDLAGAFAEINRRIHDEGRQVGGGLGMGSTLTVIRLVDEAVCVGHVGDCSVVLIRDGVVTQLTVDHTMEAEIRSRMKAGDKTYLPEYFSHTLTRCMGQHANIQPDLSREGLQPGDRILVCSDGINKILEDGELLAECERAETPHDFLDRLIALVHLRGAPDNATGVAVFVDAD